MKGEIFDNALNYEIGSNDNTNQAAERSQKLRAPLYDIEVSGERTQEKVRPHWVERAVEKIAQTDKALDEDRRWVRELTLKAAFVPKSLLDAVHPPLLIIADGALLGPALSDIFPTFEADWARFLTGLAASYTIALAGGAIGFMARGPIPPPYDKVIGILAAGAVGAAVGNFLGEATGDGVSAVVLFRTALTACTCAAMAAAHFKRAIAKEAWSPVTEARKVVSHGEAKQNKEVREVKKYQEQSVANEWSHRSRECSRHEGLLVGAFAHREQGVRASYVPKRLSSWLDKFFSIAAFLFVSLAASNIAQADSRTVVLDTTASISEKDLPNALQQKLFALKPGTAVKVWAYLVYEKPPSMWERMAVSAVAGAAQGVSDATAKASQKEGYSDIAADSKANSAELQAIRNQAAKGGGEGKIFVIASDLEPQT